MGRMYVIQHTAVSVTGAITIIQLKSGASSTCKIHRISVTQSASTTSAMTRIQVLRKSAAATVTSFTPLLLDAGDGAAKAVGGTAATGITASAEGTDGDILYQDSFNALTGWLYVPVPEERIVIGGGGIVGVKFPSAPTLTITCSLLFEEAGG